MSDVEQETPEEGTTGPTTIPDEERDPVQEGEPLPEQTDDEPGDDEEPDQPEPPEEPESAAPKTDREMEAIFRKLESLRKTVARRVGEIFEEDANTLMDCPLCAGVAPGYLWPPDVAPLAEEQTTALRLLLNMPVATNYRQADDFLPCPKCDGLGRVRTGSQVQNYEIAECPRCFAKGYIASPVRLVESNGHAHEQEADFTTGPTRYGTELPTTDPETASVIQSLKDRGYMVVEPLAAPRPASL